MEHKSIIKNNKGGGLILVIGCVALLSMIGAMLLVVTNNNRKMKELEHQAQKSFYGAESGSDELVSQLEIEAEEALKKAFADLMVQYSLLDSTDARQQRYAEFFQTALVDEVSGSEAAEDIMRDALGLGSSDPLDVEVSFGSVETTPYTTGSEATEICIKNATFTYSAGGSQTSITTDIKIKTKMPNVDGSMADTIACDFSDFAVISGADVSTVLNTTQTVNIKGNLYAKNSLLHSSNGMTMKIEGADKVLLAGDLQVSNGAKLVIDNPLGSGEGVWANGIAVTDGGELTANSNFYVSDDLTIEKAGAKVVITGSEYIGYSGGDATIDKSAANSAITINTAKDITLDLSGTDTLVLNGSSYIRDALWNTGDAANALGVLQGESVAYKDMQSMYLIPGECLTTKHNPMTLSEYNTAAAAGCLMTSSDITYKRATTGGEATFSLREYLGLGPTDPITENQYVVRHVKLDGGATEFVYLYINFKNDKMAQKYFRDYMAIDELAGPLKKRLTTLGNSTIKLAQNNYTLANAFRYDYSAPEETSYGVQDATTSYAQLSSASLLAKRRTSGLFTNFRLNSSSTATRNYDIISNKIVKMDKLSSVTPNTWIKNTYTINGVTYDFWVHNGDVVLESDAPTRSGIILVKGKLKLANTSMDFKGLVLATGGVEFDSATKLTSDQTAVEALLTQTAVQQYFYANGGGTPASPYLSSEAVSISFENWQKN